MQSTMRVLVAAAVFSVAQGVHLRTSTEGDDCGKGFDNLNEGSQKYFGTLKGAFWTHPGRLQQFGVFEKELQCWFSYMMTTKCGGLASEAANRKKELTGLCQDNSASWFKVWEKYSDAEKKWFKKSYPNDEHDNYATADFRQAASTTMELNRSEEHTSELQSP